jgi:hypothetical protein
VGGWECEFEEDGALITAVTWSGGEVSSREFQEFELHAQAPDSPGDYAFNAVQTCKDGSEVERTGARTPESRNRRRRRGRGPLRRRRGEHHGGRPAGRNLPTTRGSRRPAKDGRPGIAAAWMGGILAFPTLLLGSLRKAQAETRSELLDRSIPRFSRVATLAVAVLAVTGFYAGLQHVPDLTALLETNYGRALILKIFLVLMMLAIGAVNLVDRNRNDSFDTMVGFELAFAAAVFVATGFLTTLTPADAGMP